MKYIYQIEKLKVMDLLLKVLKNLIEKNVKIIFTVDCGTLSFEAIDFAKKNNIDVIVLDHHQSEINLPKAYSIVNP